MERENNNEVAKKKKTELKISEKKYITLNEAVSYFHIGIGKMRELTDNTNAVLYIGKKRLINREKFEAELEAMEGKN